VEPDLGVAGVVRAAGAVPRAGRPGRYDYTYPSPDGRLALVFDWPGNQNIAGIRFGMVPLDRIDDPAAVRWVHRGYIGRSFVWSPDSRRLWVQALLHGVGRPGNLGRWTATGYVIEAGSLTVRKLALTPVGPSAAMTITFGAGGAGYAWAFANGPKVTGWVHLLDERGRDTRNIAIGGLTELPEQPFSPDGTRVVVGAAHQARVLDLASGATRSTAAGRAAGWYDDASYLVIAGRALERVELATGRVIGTWTVAPAGGELAKVWVGQLSGPLPPGAIVL
jgi:hypothetical protein